MSSGQLAVSEPFGFGHSDSPSDNSLAFNDLQRMLRTVLPMLILSGCMSCFFSCSINLYEFVLSDEYKCE